MKTVRYALLSVFCALTAHEAEAQNTNCADDLVSGETKSADLFDCMRALQAEIVDLAKLQTQIGEKGAPPVVPAGAVLAFDRPAGCPAGWKDMGADWHGKMIVAGVTDTNDRYGFRRTGGAETHTLTQGEMPAHQHDTMVFQGSVAGDGQSVWSAFLSDVRQGNAGGKVPLPASERGEGKPHNNMPPYVALYLCKKEGQ